VNACMLHPCKAIGNEYLLYPLCLLRRFSLGLIQFA
jgi:hypothetical protein